MSSIHRTGSGPIKVTLTPRHADFTQRKVWVQRPINRMDLAFATATRDNRMHADKTAVIAKQEEFLRNQQLQRRAGALNLIKA